MSNRRNAPSIPGFGGYRSPTGLSVPGDARRHQGDDMARRDRHVCITPSSGHEGRICRRLRRAIGDIATWLDILIEALEVVACANGDVAWTNSTEYTWSAVMRVRQLYSRCLRKAIMRAHAVASGANTEIRPLKALQTTSSEPSAMFAVC